VIQKFEGQPPTLDEPAWKSGKAREEHVLVGLIPGPSPRTYGRGLEAAGMRSRFWVGDDLVGEVLSRPIIPAGIAERDRTVPEHTNRDRIANIDDSRRIQREGPEEMLRDERGLSLTRRGKPHTDRFLPGTGTIEGRLGDCHEGIG